MAKNRDPFPELATGPAPSAIDHQAEDAEAKNAASQPRAEPQPTAADIAAMKRRIAEWEAENLPATRDPNAPELAPNFVVSVPDAPTTNVYAVDAANAWEAYRRKTGMRSTIHTPTITRISAH